jgi:hypothetical protein
MDMITTGILKVNSGVSRLNGMRLAIQGEADPFGAATNFLANRGLDHNDFIFVDGTNGFVGNVPVNFIIDAGFAAPEIVGTAATKVLISGAKKTAGKKSGKKRSTKKSAPGGAATNKSSGNKSAKASRTR